MRHITKPATLTYRDFTPWHAHRARGCIPFQDRYHQPIMLFSHWARDYCTQLMLSEDRRPAIKSWDISERCLKHDEEGSDMDACPCSGAIWYGEDGVEEGIKRLKGGHALLAWFWWYIRPSSEPTCSYPKTSQA
jgi:hypothetical protein